MRGVLCTCDGRWRLRSGPIERRLTGMVRDVSVVQSSGGASLGGWPAPRPSAALCSQTSLKGGIPAVVSGLLAVCQSGISPGERILMFSWAVVVSLVSLLVHSPCPSGRPCDAPRMYVPPPPLWLPRDAPLAPSRAR